MPDAGGKGCPGCGSEIPPPKPRGGPRKWCSIQCSRRAAKAAHKRRHPDRVREQLRVQQRRTYVRHHEARKLRMRLEKYGLTEEELFGMYADQGGCCASCGRVILFGIPGPTGGAHRNAAHVDHCHDRGDVRALLCSRCNRTLGMVEDDPSVLEAMIRYLEAHRAG